jgi:hypothetical protein
VLFLSLIQPDGAAVLGDLSYIDTQHAGYLPPGARVPAVTAPLDPDDRAVGYPCQAGKLSLAVPAE